MKVISVKNINFEKFENVFSDANQKTLTDTKYYEEIRTKILPLIKQLEILANNYEIVVTNPPYMGNSGMNKTLTDYLKKNFKDSKKDLFAVFIERCRDFTYDNGLFAMITQHSFMFLSSYEKLREKILENNFINMAHLGIKAFEEIGGEVVQTTSFVIRKSNLSNYLSTFVRLIEQNSQKSKEKSFLNHENIFKTSIDEFSSIPGSPIAYWVEPELINAFIDGKNLSTFADVKQGLATADNNRFLRLWHEVDINSIGFNMNDYTQAKNSGKKWFPYNKGGDFRKWYGNQEYLVNWENDGYEIKNFKDAKGKLRSRPQNTDFYFRDSLSWSKISSGNIAFRFFQNGFLFDVAGCSIFTDEDKMYLLGFLNSQVCGTILGLISPTLNYEVGHISSLPIIFSKDKINPINEIVKENIELSKNEWDSFETSWNFKKHPLIQIDKKLISEAYEEWNENTKKSFNKLMENEKKLNEFFIKIYGLKKDSISEIDEGNIALRIANLERDIKSFFILLYRLFNGEIFFS